MNRAGARGKPAQRKEAIVMMKWFGKPQNALCRPQLEIPTPVGAPCIYCEEPIEAEDFGVSIPCFQTRDQVTDEPQHFACFFRNIIGSVAHQKGLCSCRGLEDLSELGMTRREGAIAAWVYYRAHAKETVH